MPAKDTFCAIDFETASYDRNSACAVSVVRVEDGAITHEASTLIRPPGGHILPRFTAIHGISPNDVRDAPPFAEAWRTLRPMLRGASFLAAHNAPFDRSVLHASCRASELPIPRRAFACTVALARARWGIFPTRLPDVCQHLGIELEQHHDALADARACAEIVIRANAEEKRPRRARG